MCWLVSAWKLLMQALSVGIGEIWEGRLAQHISKLCNFKNSHAGGQSRTKVFHSLEFDQQGQAKVQHSWHHECEQRGCYTTRARPNNWSTRPWFCHRPTYSRGHATWNVSWSTNGWSTTSCWRASYVASSRAFWSKGSSSKASYAWSADGYAVPHSLPNVTDGYAPLKRSMRALLWTLWRFSDGGGHTQRSVHGCVCTSVCGPWKQGEMKGAIWFGF